MTYALHYDILIKVIMTMPKTVGAGSVAPGVSVPPTEEMSLLK